MQPGEEKERILSTVKTYHFSERVFVILCFFVAFFCTLTRSQNIENG